MFVVQHVCVAPRTTVFEGGWPDGGLDTSACVYKKCNATRRSCSATNQNMWPTRVQPYFIFYYILEPRDLFHRIRAEMSFNFHLRMLKTVEYEPKNDRQTSRSQLYMFDEQHLTNDGILRPWDPSHWIWNAFLTFGFVGNANKHSVST